MINLCQSLGFIAQDSKGNYFDVEVIIEKIHNYYKNEKTLYIFDNVDDESIRNIRIYISKKPNSFTLITSQWRMWSDNVHKIQVDVFSPEDAFIYVKKKIKLNNEKTIRELVKELGFHPFAITQAIKYINMHDVSIETYINRYKSDPIEILDNETFQTQKEAKSAIKAINLVLLKLQNAEIVPLKILNFLSHCDGQNISKHFLIQISKYMEIRNEHILDKAILLLQSYSLLDGFCFDKYTMHELTQLSCRYFQIKNSSTNTYLDLIENYFRFEFKNNGNYELNHVSYGNNFVFHFLYLFRTNKKKMSEAFHSFADEINKFLNSKGLFLEAIEILKSIESFNAETYGENNERTLNIKNDIAICLKDLGNFKEALNIHYCVDKIKTKLLGINHPLTLSTKGNIAICLANMGKYNEALEILLSVDEIQTKMFGTNHLFSMVVKSNIACCFHKMKMYNNAFDILLSLDKTQTEILGINHPSTIDTKNNLAVCLQYMEKYEEALEIHYSVDKIKTEILGTNHPSTLETKRNIAVCFCNMGLYDQSLEVNNLALKILTEVLGNKHPLTMSTKNNMGNCLLKLEKYNEALEVYCSVAKINKKILGIEHPSTMETKMNIANCFSRLGKFNEALKIQDSVDKTATEVLGISHPLTLDTKNNIANTLFQMEKYNEALEMFRFVAKKKSEIFGIDHTSTMLTKYNFTICLSELEKRFDLCFV